MTARNLPGRLRRLELAQRRNARHLDERGRTPAEVLRERRLRRLGAEGRALAPEPARVANEDRENRPQTLSELIRRARFERRREDSLEGTK